MTNGLDVAMELATAAGVDVLMTGGALRKMLYRFLAHKQKIASEIIVLTRFSWG